MIFSSLLAQATGDSPFGTIQPPTVVKQLNDQAGGIGILIFVSNGIKLATIVAGLWILFNFVSAAFMYITAAGDTAVPNKVKDQIVHSVIGLGFIVFSYLAIALISYFFFGKTDYILNPTIIGPAGVSP